MNEIATRLAPVAPLIYFAIVLNIALFILSILVGRNREERCLNVLFVLLGMGMSVPIGLLLSPVTTTEQSQFGAVGNALLTFASGYLVSKLDRTIATALAPENLLTRSAGFRALAFLICFGVGVTTFYAARSQWISSPI